MKWQEVSKVLAGFSTLGVVGLFSYLLLLTGMDYSHSGDSDCSYVDGVYQCDAFINISTKYWNFEFEHLDSESYIYLPMDLDDFTGKLTRYRAGDLDFVPVLYKKSTYGRKLWVNLDRVNKIIDTQPNIRVDWMVPTRGKDNWRLIKEGDTWARLKNNRIKLIGYPESEFDTIKWSFIVGDIDIDPFWHSGAKYETTHKDINGKKAVEIRFNNLHKEYNLKAEALRQNKKPKELLNVKKTKYYGDVNIKLMHYVNVTTQNSYECDCIYHITYRPNGTEQIETTCDTCYKEETNEVFQEIDPETFILKNNNPIYEVFDGATRFEKQETGWGYAVWTDVNIMGLQIDGATWWNESYGYRYEIILNTSDVGIYSVNDNRSVDTTTIWTYIGASNYLYSVSSGPAGDLSVGNETSEKYWENQTSRNGTNVDLLWSEMDVEGVWHFEESSGNVYDSSGNGNTGTASGNPTYSATGVFGNAITLDGSGDYFSLGAPSSLTNLDGTNGMTLIAWIDANNDDGAILGRDDIGSNRIFQFGLRNTNKLYCYIWDSDSYASVDGTGSAISTTTFSLVSCVYDENDNKVKTYINGVLQDTSSASITEVKTAGGEPICIGAYKTASCTNGQLSAIIDEPRMYNQSLSADEQLRIYWNGIGNHTRLGAEETPAVFNGSTIACRTLDEAYGTYYLDTSITNSDYDKCMNITASHITFDCQGNTIDGDTAPATDYGIYLSSVENITIKNCILSDWDDAAIYLVSSTTTNITNVTVTECEKRGIKLLSSNSTTITDTNTSTTNGVDAISIDNSSHITITNCVLSDDADAGSAGVWIDLDSDYVNVSESTIKGGWAAINIYGSDAHSREIYIYNNFFNNTDNYVDDDGGAYNAVGVYLNTTQQTGTRVYTSGPEIGGNYWTDPDGNYSDSCTDTNEDGFCDSSYTPLTHVTDYLPLSTLYTAISSTTLYLNGTSSDRYYEHGSYANLSTCISDYTGTCATTGSIWLDIDAFGYGVNYTTDTDGRIDLDFRALSTIDDFNASTTAKNLTANGSIYFTINNQAEISSMELNLTGYNVANYPTNIKIDIGDDGSEDIILDGLLNSSTMYVTEFTNSQDAYLFQDAGAQLTYMNLSTVLTDVSFMNITVSGSKLNFTESSLGSTNIHSSTKDMIFRYNDTLHLVSVTQDTTTCTNAWVFTHYSTTNNGQTWSSGTSIGTSSCNLGWTFWTGFMNQSGEIYIVYDSANTSDSDPVSSQSIWGFHSYGDRGSWTTPSIMLQAQGTSIYYSGGGTQTSNGEYHLSYYGTGCSSICYANSSDGETYTTQNNSLISGSFTPHITSAQNDDLYIISTYGKYVKSTDDGTTWDSAVTPTYPNTVRWSTMSVDSDAGKWIVTSSSDTQHNGAYISTDGTTFTLMRTIDFDDFLSRDCINNVSTGAMICVDEDNSIWEYDFPRKVLVDVGYDEVYEIDTYYLTDPQTISNTTILYNYMDTSQKVPIYMSTQSSGNISFDEIEARYTFNPIDISTTTLNNLLSGSGDTNISIGFKADQYGAIGVSGFNMSYKGSENITITSHNADYSINDTQELMIVWSNMTLTKPYTWTDDLLIYPETNSSTDVEPYYQTSTTPIWNLTSSFYHDQNVNISVKLDEALDSCVNVTANIGYYSDNASVLSTTETEFIVNQGSTSSGSIYLFFDLDNCSYSNLYIQPNFTIYPYCSTCVW